MPAPKVPADVPAPPVPLSRGGALAKFTPMHTELPQKNKLLVDNQVEILGPPSDDVGDETDSDDGDNGDFEEVEPFIPVAGGRSTNSSRSASISFGFSPPMPITLTSNVFKALLSDFIMPVALIYWDFR